MRIARESLPARRGLSLGWPVRSAARRCAVRWRLACAVASRGAGGDFVSLSRYVLSGDLVICVMWTVVMCVFSVNNI